MPCRCDDFEPYQYNRRDNKYEYEHTLRCKSQSLIHKLKLFIDKNSLTLPEKLLKGVEEARDLLVKHKREELTIDNQALADEINKLADRIKQIKSLGGLVPTPLLIELEEKKRRYESMVNISDIGLLGGI